MKSFDVTPETVEATSAIEDVSFGVTVIWPVVLGLTDTLLT